AAPAAAGVDRCAGAALRLLPERHDDPGCRPPRDDEEPVRGSDQDGDERPPVPLRYLSENPDRDPEGRGCHGEGWCVDVTGFMHEKEFSRKSFIKGGGALIVGVSVAGALSSGAGAANFTPPTSAGYLAGLDQTQLDVFLRVNADNTVTVTFGSPDWGHGV